MGFDNKNTINKIMQNNTIKSCTSWFPMASETCRLQSYRFSCNLILQPKKKTWQPSTFLPLGHTNTIFLGLMFFKNRSSTVRPSCVDLFSALSTGKISWTIILVGANYNLELREEFSNNMETQQILEETCSDLPSASLYLSYSIFNSSSCSSLHKLAFQLKSN